MMTDALESGSQLLRMSLEQNFQCILLSIWSYSYVLVFLPQATKSGGVAVLVGMGASEVRVPVPAHILCREVDIRGIFRYANS